MDDISMVSTKSVSGGGVVKVMACTCFLKLPDLFGDELGILSTHHKVNNPRALR